MSGDNGFRRPPREKNAMDNNKLVLHAPNRIGKMASLQWAMVDNHPRILVYTNDPDDQNENYGKIEARFDLPAGYALLAALETLIQQGEKDNLTMDCGKPGWDRNANRPSGQIVVTASVKVGRDEDGTIWIALSAPRRPNIKFPFGLSQYIQLRKVNGDQLNTAETSVVMAKAYIKMLGHMLANVNVQLYKHPERKDGGQGGGNGGGNRGGQGGGGYGGNRNNDNRGNQSSNDKVEDDGGDDIPW